MDITVRKAAAHLNICLEAVAHLLSEAAARSLKKA